MIRTATASSSASVKRRLGPKQQPDGEGERGDRRARPGRTAPRPGRPARWIGAFEPCASSTRRDDLGERGVVADARRAEREASRCVLMRRRRSPRRPARLSTGSDSPVSIDSSTADAPSTIDAVGRHPLARPHAHEVAGRAPGRSAGRLRARRAARARWSAAA